MGDTSGAGHYAHAGRSIRPCGRDCESWPMNDGASAWRLFILLRREGEASGINRIYRLYRDEG